MVTVNDVYRKIKEISAREWNPRPAIPVANLSKELSSNQETIIPMLTELTDIKLISFTETSKSAVKLTLLGHNVERSKL